MVSLTAAALDADGKLPSLDITLGVTVPALASDPRACVTLRQLLAHVSGVADGKDARGINLPEFNRTSDIRSFLLKLGQAEPAGTKFRYNNSGIRLASLMLEQISGTKLSKHVDRRIFAPLGVRSASARPTGCAANAVTTINSPAFRFPAKIY
jgi:D-alanyl-D-alanine carboxypeptidase